MTHWPRRGTKAGDVYSFGVIFKEILCRDSPYAEYDDLSPKGNYHHFRVRVAP